MPVNTIVKDPRRIKTLAEAEETLADIIKYEQETGESVGVLKLQNRQLGPIHYITSQKEADAEMNKPVSSETSEWGLKFYSRDYFEELKRRLCERQN